MPQDLNPIIDAIRSAGSASLRLELFEQAVLDCGSSPSSVESLVRQFLQVSEDHGNVVLNACREWTRGADREGPTSPALLQEIEDHVERWSGDETFRRALLIRNAERRQTFFADRGAALLALTKRAVSCGPVGGLEELREGVKDAIELWTGSHLSLPLIPDNVPWKSGYSFDDFFDLILVSGNLGEGHETCLAAFRDLVLRWQAVDARQAQPARSFPIYFEGRNRGAHCFFSAERMSDDRGVLFPDLRCHNFTPVDEGFAASLELAWRWTWAEEGKPEFSVRWRVPKIAELAGASGGVMIGATLAALRADSPSSGKLFIGGSAEILPDGQLGSVKGIEAKFHDFGASLPESFSNACRAYLYLCPANTAELRGLANRHGIEIRSRPSLEEATSEIVGLARGRHEVLKRYLSKLIEEHSTIRGLTPEHAIPLSKTAVPLRIAGGDRETDVREQQTTGDTPPHRQPNVSEVSLEKGWPDRPVRAVIRGDAGTGKTTLTRMLVLHSARSALDSLGPSGESEDFLLPVLMDLRETAHVSALECEDSLADALERIAIGQLDLALTADQKGWLAWRIRSKGLLLIMEGWDEAGPDAAKLFGNKIRRFVEAHPSCQVLLTSRPASGEALPIAFPEKDCFRMERLAPSAIESFVTAWFDSRSKPPESQELLRYLRQSSPRVRDLARTPLLLYLLCLVWEEEFGDAPASRTELYERVINKYLHWRWETSGREEAEPLWVPAVLSSVAFAFYENSDDDSYTRLSDKSRKEATHGALAKLR